MLKQVALSLRVVCATAQIRMGFLSNITLVVAGIYLSLLIELYDEEPVFGAVRSEEYLATFPDGGLPV